jgi:hypothetical protein
MMTVHADVQTSRRRHLHYVFDEFESLRFSAAKMGPVFDWLYENGEGDFRVKTGNNLFSVDLVRITD